VGGSIPSTTRASTIPEPLYDYDPQTGQEQPSLSNDRHVTVMAVDNLPCELPRSASEEFGRDLIDRILPLLFVKDADGALKRATIAKGGQLTENFTYLEDYVAEK
jgi:hypothetical protein